MSICYSREVSHDFAQAIARTKEELAKDGFGVLSEIDVKAKLKEKLNVDFCDYVILGACNPALAHVALQKNIDIGVFMPCNVVVYRKDGKTVVSAVNPNRTVGSVDDEELCGVAEEVEKLLKQIVDRI